MSRPVDDGVQQQDGSPIAPATARPWSSWRPSAPVRYVAGAAIAFMSAWLQYVIVPRPEIAPFVLFPAAVAIASWFGGRGPGLLATALLAVIGNYVFVTPFGAFVFQGAGFRATGLFVVSGTTVSLFCGALRSAMEEADAKAASLRQTTQRLRAQDWVNGGQTKLAAEVRGELTEAETASGILSFVARYLDAKVGVLYAWTDDGTLRRAATFACSESGSGAPPASLTRGEGWVGQVARDGRLVSLADVPEDHIRVVTSTGESRPRHLLVAPLTGAGSVVGVLELGFFSAPEGRATEFLGAVAEIAGMALGSARYRAHLQALLLETQRQAMALQSQQEELRVANEELQEQSLALQTSQAQLEAQQEELRTTNTHLEEQTQTLESQRDQLGRAQKGLVEKADELARANQYKSEFLANMSHELRTPLNSLLILAKLLVDNKGQNLTGEQVRFAQTIHSAGTDLLALINDILDLSRIEAGRVDIELVPVDVARIVDGLVHTFQPLAHGKPFRFDAVVEPGAPATIRTDARRLQQILSNLLANATKFTARGEVTLCVAALGAERVAFRVRDTGIGIPKEKLELIFEAFRQADGSTGRQFGGTGLGLTISRSLARRLGGDILVESAPGQGSTFTLVLPVRFGADAPATAEQPPRSGPVERPRHAPSDAAAPTGLDRGSVASVSAAVRSPDAADDRDALTLGSRTLLVIEDDLRFARILYDLAHEQQFRCLLAPTAAEGLELASRHRPSGILLDVNLPDSSGLTVLERLKHSSETRHIPVHVVSVLDNTQRALELGAVGYALKPVDRETLASAFQRLREKSEQRGGRVLVVEDVEMQRESLRHLLQSDGVEIIDVGTAALALEQLAAKTFDCMVLDLGLPDMSGYDLLEKMSHDCAFSFPPVIVYTGRSLEPDEELRLRRYSTSVVIKGARSPERLLDEVTLFLHRVEATLSGEQQRMLREVRDREAIFEGRRILLAEDDVRNIFALSSVLEPKGARLEIARNGREALEVLDRAIEKGERIDLVLMDLMMPEMEGLTAIREIRTRAEWRKLPIVALTAKAMPDDREKCLEAGANDYIAKPIDVEKLLSLVRVWMPR